MKITSYPPMIILLDMLFVFLFILVLNQKKVINIYIPEYELFTNAKIVYLDSSTHRYYTLNGIEHKFENSMYHLALDECNEQSGCQEAKKKFGKNVYIALPSNLFNEMAKINMLAFGTKSCTKLDFFVKDNGILDYKRIIKKNRCLEKISGLKEVFNSKNMKDYDAK